MWEDYKALKTEEERQAFIRKFGAPMEWKT